MSLLREIQTAAISGEAGGLAPLLRRCKVLAVRLGSTEFERWVDQELNGYSNDAELPDYRRDEANSYGTFVGIGGSQAQNVPIPPSCLPEPYREQIAQLRLTQPVSAYEDLLRSDNGTFQIPWGGDLVRLASGKVYEHMSMIAAWRVIPRGALVTLLDTVRNRILSFALDIEKVAPGAGEASPGTQPIPAETVQQVFNTTIYGSVGNVAAGSPGATQSVGALVATQDFASLQAALLELGLSTEDAIALRDAIDKDGTADNKGIGAAAGAWLGEMLAKASRGLLKISVDTAAAVLPKLILRYLGLPPGEP